MMEQASTSSIRSDRYVSYSLTIEHMIPFSKALSSRKKKTSRDFFFNFISLKFYCTFLSLLPDIRPVLQLSSLSSSGKPLSYDIIF